MRSLLNTETIMFKGVQTRLLLSTLLLAAAVAAGVVCLFWELYPLTILCALGAFGALWMILRLYRYNLHKITFMFNAIESGDHSFRFTERGRNSYDKFFNMALNRIKDLLSQARTEAREQEKYYELILSSVVTGVLVINEKGSVFQTNGEALRLLGIHLLTHVNQLARVDETLPATLLSLRDGESRSLTLQNERGTTHLALQASPVTIRGERLTIVSINDIERQLDEKELESWVRLTRVLTHEIMNAITPVVSLSDTLLHLPGATEDIRGGLEVIHSTGKGLIEFVDSYRSFTRIAQPHLKLLYVKPLLERLKRLTEEDIRGKDIAIEIEVSEEDLMIQADENQVSQVLLNLMKNAAAAIGERSGGEGPGGAGSGTGGTGGAGGRIRLSACCDRDENVVIEVANNGSPIPPEVAEQIFVPFFTTKAEGSGIGLSISRQIMRLHGGSIKLLHSNERETAFALVFR